MFAQNGPTKSERKLWSLRDDASNQDLRIVREFDAKAVLAFIVLLCITLTVGLATVFVEPKIAAWTMIIIGSVGLIAFLVAIGRIFYTQIEHRYKSNFVVDNKEQIKYKLFFEVIRSFLGFFVISMATDMVNNFAKTKDITQTLNIHWGAILIESAVFCFLWSIGLSKMIDVKDKQQLVMDN